ncbi:MAG: glucose-6-phosphate isomerase [Oscillospiraceae bacterium]|nr:glucose-6-phosphate isomerase [Oscillospiraceae bacterium]
MINIDITGIPSIPSQLLDEARHAWARVKGGNGTFKDWNGWVTLPETTSDAEIAKIKLTAEKIRTESQMVVVLGIGGSYLGARAAIDFLKSDKYNIVTRNSPRIFFAGNNLSAPYTQQIMSFAASQSLSLIVVSKSGKTLETSVAFRIFYNLMKAKYGEKARERIYVITDPEKGALREFADKNGCISFPLPSNIGGRYSVLTAVGLLPMAVAGIDIAEVINGAKSETSPEDALTYAAARQHLYRSGKKLELLASFEPNFRYMGEWWRQLFAESEGKEFKGIFPVFEELTADLHSVGQYVQEGERTVFETFINFDTSAAKLIIPAGDINDGYDRLVGMDYNLIAKASKEGIKKAHTDGGTPVIELNAESISPFTFGAAVQFFLISCATSGVMLGVDPFNQPGVEAYKKNFFPALDKLV